MKIEQLKRNLLAAQARLEQMNRQGAASLKDLLAAHEAINQAERALAAAQGQEYAVELDLGIVPEAAVSGAHLFEDENHHFLAFNAMRRIPDKP